MPKYKILMDIPNWFKEGIAISTSDPWYKRGDVIEYNEWTKGWHKDTDLYLYRMITEDIMKKNPHYFKEI